MTTSSACSRAADTVVDITPVVRDAAQGDPRLLINAVIEKFADYRPRIEAAVASGAGVPLASVKLRPPIPRPGNIDCMAVNYVEEMVPTPPPSTASTSRRMRSLGRARP